MTDKSRNINCGCTRREFGATAGLGVGSLLMSGILSQLSAAERGADRAGRADPLAPKAPHFPAKAKRVIFLFMSGGASHVETFDPKPRLFADHGKSVAINEWQGKPGKYERFLKKPHWAFKPGGKCGTEVSDLFPHVRECMDDICVIRSLKSDHTNHYEATLGMHTGSFTFARPSIGSWASYGLGTVNRNLPSFVAIAPQTPDAGGQVWGSDFLPGCHQGTRVVPGPEAIPNMNRRTPSAELQGTEMELLRSLNAGHLSGRAGDPNLEARIRSFETAFGMQQEAPEAFDFSKESDETLKLYGLERGSAKGFAWQCLAARRLVERGVRFVELIDVGSAANWDAHGDMNTHLPLAKNVDRPIAALLKDLKSRGMLDDTLVVWTTEFGRTPFNTEAGHKGREHHHWVFSSWLAGGGVKGGITYGSSDDCGINVAENPVHVHDFHATILHLMGLDHERLTFRHAGRDYRLTDVHGHVVRDILA
jgi:hypothetical protein